jgi:DNA polymerase-3 subunit gamma/tau
MDSLAIKYRPKTWDDICEQKEIVDILTNQIKADEIKHGYLFTGPAGCGKTTAARIFANSINKGMGQPIELDAASNNSVDDIRRLIDDAQTQAIDSDYKVFIIDECHMITPQGWNAFLKTLEEPPTKAIFIMATTNPEKIPATILSRVQRYNFKKISQQGIVDRLRYILQQEDNGTETLYPNARSTVEQINLSNSLTYIAKIAEGGMRDAITMLDKCLSYSTDLTVENVSKALGVADYTTMFALTQAIVAKNRNSVIQIIQNVYDSGFDIKLFIKQYFEYVLNLTVYGTTGDVSLTTLPSNDAGLENLFDYAFLIRLTDMICQLNYALKYEQNPRVVVLARVLIFVEDFK